GSSRVPRRTPPDKYESTRCRRASFGEQPGGSQDTYQCRVEITLLSTGRGAAHDHEDVPTGLDARDQAAQDRAQLAAQAIAHDGRSDPSPSGYSVSRALKIVPAV